MAEGDYLANQNNGDTTAITTSNYTLPFTFTFGSIGTDVSYAASAMTVTDAAPYLIMYNSQFATTDTTANDAFEIQSEILINGSPIEAGKGSGFIPKTNGALECTVNGRAIVELSASDTVSIRVYRTDSSVGGTLVRGTIGNLNVLQLRDREDFGIYSKSATQVTTGSLSTILFNTVSREDQAFTLNTSTGVVTINVPGKFLLTFGGDASIALTNGSELIGDVLLNSTRIVGGRFSTYLHGADGCQDQGLNGSVIFEAVKDDTVEVQVLDIGDVVTLGANFQLGIWALPSNAESCIVEATTGNFNLDFSGFSWDTLKQIDAAAFTHTAGTDAITADASAFYVGMYSLARTSQSTEADVVPQLYFEVDNSGTQNALSMPYNSGTGSFGYMCASDMVVWSDTQFYSSGLQARVYNDVQIANNTNAVANETGQFAMFRFDDIFGLLASAGGVDVVSTSTATASATVSLGLQTGTASIVSTFSLTSISTGPPMTFVGTTSITSDHVVTSAATTTVPIVVQGVSDIVSSHTLAGFVTAPERYRYTLETLGASIIFDLDSVGAFQDLVVGDVFGTTSGDDVTTAAICEDCTNTSRLTTTTSYLRINTAAPGTDDMFEPTDRHTVAGWFMVTAIQQPTCRIFGETAVGKSFAILLGFGNTVTFEVDDDTFNVQVYSDITLKVNRVYHFCMIFEGSGFGNELRCYIDGVKQLSGVPVSRQPDATTLGLRVVAELGDAEFSTTQMGGVNFSLAGPVNGSYNMWSWFDGASAVLSDTDVREQLFEKGVLPTATIASGSQAAMQTSLDALASTVRVDAPLCIRVEAVVGDGDLSLSADDITFDSLASIHVQYMGTGTLTWTNTNGGDASIGSTESGTIVFVTNKTVTVTVLDASTLLPIVGASVRLEADTGGPATAGSQLLFLATDALGVAQTTTYSWSGNQLYTGNARKASAAPYYKPKTFAGTITENGASVVVLMRED